MSKSQYHLEHAAWTLKTEQSKSLLSIHRSVPQYGAVPQGSDSSLLEKKKTIGFWSAVFIIFNRIIGTGYAWISLVALFGTNEVPKKYLRHASSSALSQWERWNVNVSIFFHCMIISANIFAGRSGW